MAKELRVEIRSAADIVTVRQKGRGLAMALGFGGSDLTVIATAISEIARSIVNHASHGEVTLFEIQRGTKHGICISARDERPGLANVKREKQNGFLAHDDMAIGSRVGKWPMECLKIQSRAGEGTRITVQKWLD